jgi:hypothetical protein
MVTTLLCMLPPSVGSGWQTIATTGCGKTPKTGRERPARKRERRPEAAFMFDAEQALTCSARPSIPRWP